MLSILTNLTKAVVAVAVTPASVVVDVVKLPATAYDGRHPFDSTKRRLQQASEAMDAAVRPLGGDGGPDR